MYRGVPIFDQFYCTQIEICTEFIHSKMYSYHTTFQISTVFFLSMLTKNDLKKGKNYKMTKKCKN